MSRETKNLFPVIQTSPVLQGERGTIVYVLMGALAVSGGLAVVADRNLRSVNEQAFEGASALARETNVSALNMLKTLMAMPVGNPSARNPQHVPAVFPDKYVNSTSPYSSKIDLIADNLPATAQAIWRVNRASAVPEIQISSPDLRFISATAREANIFSAAHYSAAPSGPASVQTRITSVMPVYSGALITAYDVAVDSRVAISARDASKGSRTVTTKARIAVDPPPVPECDMTVSTSGPVIPNTPIVANFRSYGVVLSARTMQPLNSGVTQWSSVTPLSEAAKSIRSTLQGGTLLRTWTVNARSTKPFDSRQGIMAIEGDVTGPALSARSCASQVKVYIPPTCSITASPNHVPDGGSVTLAVVASGAVDSLTLLGRRYYGPAALRQTISWSPEESGQITQTAVVTGPLGMSSQCSITITKDPPRCGLATGKEKIDTAIGVVVPIFDNNFHQTWHDWVTAGGSCTNESGVTFGDRTCTPCPATDRCGRFNPQGTVTADGATFWRITNYFAGDNCQFQLGFIRSAGKGCFDATTELTMADGTKKLIAQIKQSDVLLNPVTGQARKIRRIIHGPEKEPMIELVIDGDKKLLVTKDHPFRTKFGYFPASQIRTGDIVLHSGSQHLLVTSARKVAPVPGPLDVDRMNIQDLHLPVVWNVELENISTNPDDYMVEANGIAAGDLWLQDKLKNPNQDQGS